MSGFDPTFDAAGSGSRDGSVPAPGAIDGRSYFLRADKTWAAPGSLAPGPEPPADGPDLDAWACNIAGYLTYEVSRLAVKYAVDWLPASWIGDVAGGIVAGIAGALLPASLLEGGVIEAAIFSWVSSYVSGHLVDIGTALLDDVAWAKIHCALYDKIKLTPTDLRAAILAFTAILGGLVGWTTPAIAAVTYLFEHLGIADVGNIPITAFARQYDCSTCAITGVGPTKPVLQTSFDLTVTDGATTGTFIDTLDVGNAVVAISGTTATVTPDVATASALGISRPDNTTIAVDGGGVYSWRNPMSTADDLIVGGASGVAARLAKGSDSQVLTVNPSSHHLDWETPAAPGMSNPMTTAADVIVGGTAGAASRLAKGADGQVLTVDPTTHLLVWATPDAAGMANPMTTKGDLIVGGTGGTPHRLAVGSANTFPQAVPLATDGVQWVLLQASDIPNLDTSKLTTGQLSAARGGTGLDTHAPGEGSLLVGAAGGGWQVGGIGGGNGISVVESGGGFTIANNLTAGTNISISVSGGTLIISAAGTAGGGGALPLVTVVPPPTIAGGTWTWVNQGTAAATDEAGGIVLLDTASDAQLHCLVRAAPATPYTLTAGWIFTAGSSTADDCGVLFRESSSGKLHVVECTATTAVDSRFWNSPSSFGSVYNDYNPQHSSNPLWVRIQDDGTNRIVGYSQDGLHYNTISTTARTTNLTANQIGFFVRPTSYTCMVLLSWAIT